MSAPRLLELDKETFSLFVISEFCIKRQESLIAMNTVCGQSSLLLSRQRYCMPVCKGNLRSKSFIPCSIRLLNSYVKLGLLAVLVLCITSIEYVIISLAPH